MDYGLTYLYSNDNGVTWIDFSEIVQSPTLKIEQYLCSTEFKSAIDTASFTIPEIVSSIKQNLLATLLSNVNDVLIRIIQKEGSEPLFYGVIDRSSLSVTSTSLPSKIDITCKDLSSVLLDKKVDQEIVLFDKTVAYIVDYLITVSHMTLTGGKNALETLLNANNDNYTLTAFAINKDDGDTYRSYIDTLLFECGGYVLNCKTDGTLEVVRLPWDAITNNDSSQGFRTITNYVSKTGISTKTSFLKEDGVKVKWSSIKETEDNKQQVFNAKIDLQDTADGTWKDGAVIPPQGFYPQDADISPTWLDYDSSFLDKPYLLKDSRKENKDLSIIATRNHQLLVDAWTTGRDRKQIPIEEWNPFPIIINEDLIEMGVNSNPQFMNNKAFVALQNHLPQVKDESEDDVYKRSYNIHVFKINAQVTYRDKINTLYLPALCEKPKDYTSTYIYDKNHAIKFSRFYWHFLNTSRFITTWSELNNGTLGEVVKLNHKGSNLEQFSLVVSRTLTYLNNKTLNIALTSVGLDQMQFYAPKNVPSTSGADKAQDGKDGKSTEVDIKYAFGTTEAPALKDPFVLGNGSFFIGDVQNAFGDYGIRWESYVPPQSDPNAILWQQQTVDGRSQEMRISGSKGDFGNVGKICFAPIQDRNVLLVGIYDSYGNMSTKDNSTVINNITIEIQDSRLSGLPFIVSNSVSFIACVKESNALNAPIKPRLIKPVVIMANNNQQMIWCLQNVAVPSISDKIEETLIVFVIGEFKSINLAYKIYDSPITLQDASNSNFMQLLATEDMDKVGTLSTALGFDALFERIATLEAFVNKLYANQITLFSGGSIMSENFVMPSSLPTDTEGGDKGFYLDSDGRFIANNMYANGGVFDSITIRKNSKFYGDIIAQEDGSTYFKTQRATTEGSVTLSLNLVKDWWYGSTLYSKISSLNGRNANVLYPASGTYNGQNVTHVMAYSNANLYVNIFNQTLTDYNEHSFVMPFSAQVTIDFNAPCEESETDGYWTEHVASGSGRATQIPHTGHYPSDPADGESYIYHVEYWETSSSLIYEWEYYYRVYHAPETEYSYFYYDIMADNSVIYSHVSHFNYSVSVSAGQRIRVVPRDALSHSPDNNGYLRIKISFNTTGVKLVANSQLINIISNTWHKEPINIDIDGTVCDSAMNERWSLVGSNPLSATSELLTNLAYELEQTSTFMGDRADHLTKVNGNKIMVMCGNNTYSVETNPTEGNDLGHSGLTNSSAQMTTLGELIGIQSANIVPSEHGVYNIGKSDKRFANLYVGNIYYSGELHHA